MVSTKLAGKRPWRPSLLKPLHHALSIVSTSLMMSPGSKESSFSSSVENREVSKDISNDNLHNTAAEANNSNLLGSHTTLSRAEVFLAMTRVRRKNI